MDLTTQYLGLTLKNPLVAGAGPLTGELDNIRRLEDFGAGAVVLPSIFEEQIERERQLIDHIGSVDADSYAEALSYFPAISSDHHALRSYLDLIRQAAAAVDIPIIGSLNGTGNRGWVSYARQIEQAGADALELNIYLIPADPWKSGNEIEHQYLSILRAVKEAVNIPVAVKLSPYFTSMGHVATALVQADADGLVLFNRFYQPDIDLLRVALLPNLDLSTPAEIRLPLLWIGLLSGRIGASLAAGTGVDSSNEVIKFLLAGADVVMSTSALLRHGIAHMKVMCEGLKDWLAARDLNTLDHIRGCLSQRNVTDPTAFTRANYIRTLQGYRSDR